MRDNGGQDRTHMHGSQSNLGIKYFKIRDNIESEKHQRKESVVSTRILAKPFLKSISIFKSSRFPARESKVKEKELEAFLLPLFSMTCPQGSHVEMPSWRQTLDSTGQAGGLGWR